MMVLPTIGQAAIFDLYIEHNENINVDSLVRDEGNKYCVNPDYLQLISGKLFLLCDSMLVPLKSVSFCEEKVFVEPEAVILLPCPLCGGWYIEDIPHDCNGVWNK